MSKLKEKRYIAEKLIRNQEQIEKYINSEFAYNLDCLFEIFKKINLCDSVIVFEKGKSLKFISTIDKSVEEKTTNIISLAEKIKDAWQTKSKFFKLYSEPYYGLDLNDTTLKINDAILNEKIKSIKFDLILPEEIIDLFGLELSMTNILLIRTKLLHLVNYYENEMYIFLIAKKNNVDYTDYKERFTIEQIFIQWINSFHAKVQEFNLSIENLKQQLKPIDIFFSCKKVLKMLKIVHPWISADKFAVACNLVLKKYKSLLEDQINEDFTQRIFNELISLKESVNASYESHLKLVFIDWIIFRLKLFPNVAENDIDLTLLIQKSQHQIINTLSS